MKTSHDKRKPMEEKEWKDPRLLIRTKWCAWMCSYYQRWLYTCMYVPEGRISDRSLSCRCLAGNPVTPGSVRRTRRPTIKKDERGKKREAWNRKENKEGDNVDKIKTKQNNYIISFIICFTSLFIKLLTNNLCIFFNHTIITNISPFIIIQI